MSEREQWATWLTIGGVLAFVAIGIRFLVMPDAATDFFGLASPLRRYDLHYIVGIRDLWLALLILGLGLWREWRALALTYALGTLVTWADSAVVVASGGWSPAVAFHLVSGAFFGVVGWLCWGASGARASVEG